MIAELRRLSAEVLDELAEDSEIAKRIAESVEAFKQQAMTYHGISEEAYYNARKQ